jgi:metal-sulfur cluster biosynthetic enzyme
MKQEKKDSGTESIYQALRTVIDPELGINMVDLGLLYDVKVTSDKEHVTSVHVVMTLTTPGCPLGGYFLEEVTKVTSQALEIDEEHVKVEIVFDPPWTYDMMNEESMAELGLD